jgi:hypothetical protein
MQNITKPEEGKGRQKMERARGEQDGKEPD